MPKVTDLFCLFTHLVVVGVKLRSFGDECGLGGLDKPERTGSPLTHKGTRNEQQAKRRQTSIHNGRSGKDMQHISTNHYPMF